MVTFETAVIFRYFNSVGFCKREKNNNPGKKSHYLELQGINLIPLPSVSSSKNQTDV